MAYQFQMDDLQEFVRLHGFEVKEHGGELRFKYCPYCHGGDSKDRETFSVSTETGRFNCLRNSCGEKGSFVRLARDFHFDLPDAEKKDFRIYEGFLSSLESWQTTDEAVKHLRSRGIPEHIAERWRVTTFSERPDILVFPFFDETCTVTDVKYRNMKFRKGDKSSKEWFDENTKKILYGMWLVEDFSKPLIVTEGQLDCLSLAAAGIENAVSVPGGAKNFRWTENCRNFVEAFAEIIIFGDCEDGHVTLIDGFLEKFPEKKIKVVRMTDYLKCKDANEILTTFCENGDYSESYEILRKCVENAEDARHLPVKKFSEIAWSNPDTKPVIKTLFPTLDKAVRGLAYGQLIVLTGWSGDGKSNFAAQLAVNAIHQNERVLIYSGESTSEDLKAQITRIIAGKDRITTTIQNGDYIRSFRNEQQTQQALTAWAEDRLFLWEERLISGTEIFLRNLKATVQAYKIGFVILDNLMTLLTVAEDKDLFNAQGTFAKQLKALAEELEIVLILVAHPKKAPTASRELSQDSISGAKDIVNIADMVIGYIRHCEEDKLHEGFPRRINIIKNRRTGILLEGKKGVYVRYSTISNRICETPEAGNIDYLQSYPPSAAILLDEEKDTVQF